MARKTVDRQIRVVSASKPVRTRLSAKNSAAIKLLDEWVSKPDDMGEEWWDEYERQLKEHRFTLHRES